MHAESIGIFWITVCSINLYPYCLVKETMQHRKYIFMFLFTLRQSGILLLRIDPNANVSAVDKQWNYILYQKKKISFVKLFTTYLSRYTIF